ncbi:MAG TPA: hypothetical protein VFW65_38535 [Pseudonocardiaceae bacterium]|nr:hypothetical protein [Pseudonocardiaceae bacterium]
MLSPLDDYPAHQVAEPIRYVGTSDRNFYDRYYFNCFPVGGQLMLAFGLGQYPNLGVTDAFAAVAVAGRHKVVRASRELGDDRMNLAIGPLRLEIIEGMRRLRIVCDPGDDHDISFDLTWTASVGPALEPRQVSRDQYTGRTIVDSVRLGQTGTWAGALRIGDADFEVTPDRWQGFRDRSWGVRPVGESEPKGIRTGRPFGTFYWVYAPMRFDDFSVFVAIEEDRAGNRKREHAVRVDPDGEPVSLGRVEQKLEFVPGGRQVSGAVLRFGGDDRGPVTVRVEPVLPLHIAVGTGYGLDADWKHGSYQGPLTVQSVEMSADDARERGGRYGVVEALSRYYYEGPGGPVTGWGMFEYSIIGPHDPSGFTGMTDGA